jgi:oxygen-dependent protoporphyrinogen oxidase
VRLAGKVARMALRPGPAPFTPEELAEVDDGSTLADWSRRTFGERVYEYAVRPLMGPLTGVDPTRISAAFTIALMHKVMRSQLTVPREGMGRIAEWLLAGVDVRLNTLVTSLSASGDGVVVETEGGFTFEGDGAVVATDILRARQLLADVAPQEVREALERVVPIPAYHVLLGYRRDLWPDSPYDLVVRANPGMHHNYGVLLNARRAPGSVPPGGQTVSAYFDLAQAAGLDGEEAVARHAVEAVEQAFGGPAEPDFHYVFRMDAALIAPVPGHYAAMVAARGAMPPCVRLAGDFLSHSGIEGALISGERAASDLLALAGSSAPGARTAPVSQLAGAN